MLRLWVARHDDGIFWPDEIYQSLDAAHGAQLVADQGALTDCLGLWLVNPGARKAVADAAVATIEKLGGALDRTIAALEPYLMQLRLEQGVS